MRTLCGTCDVPIQPSNNVHGVELSGMCCVVHVDVTVQLVSVVELSLAALVNVAI